MAIRPKNYDWLKPGIKVEIFDEEGDWADEFIVYKVTVARDHWKVYAHGDDSDYWSVTLEDDWHFALPENRKMLIPGRWV